MFISFVWGGFVWGFWQGGFLSRGFLSGGLCPGGFCPGGFCPDTFEKALRAVKVIKDQTQYRSQSLLNLARGYFS